MKWLDDSELKSIAPSIFAEEPSSIVSRRYQFIPTIDIVEQLGQRGWLPVAARQQNVRVPDRQGFQKHMIRFRSKGGINLKTREAKAVVNEVVPEIVGINSHDGKCAWRFEAGFFRVVCTNGLVVADGTSIKISIRHSGKDLNLEVDEMIKDATNVISNCMSSIGYMRRHSMSNRDRLDFAEEAALTKWRKTEKNPRTTLPIKPDLLLIPRRNEDMGTDLWTTYNVVQENIVRGGLPGQAATGRKIQTRAVKNIGEDIRINQAIWGIAESYLN